MSKARAWSDREKAVRNDQPAYYNDQRGLVAVVNTMGYLEFRTPAVESSVAIAFAKWILDTFEDK